MAPIFYQTIVASNPNQAVELLRANGYKINNWDDNKIIDALQHFVDRDGEQALYQLIEIHPDYDLFHNYFEEKQAYEQSLVEKPAIVNQSNTNSDDELINKLIKLKMLNATGDTPAVATTTDNNSNKIDPTNLVILASTLVIALAVVLSFAPHKNN